MATKLEQAARQALEALEEAYENGFLTGITGLKTIDTLTALREALAEQALQKLSDFHQSIEEPKCNQHPDAPHGFDRNASHNAGRYVCECEGWIPADMAYRPGGLSMDQEKESNSIFMEGYRIGLAEMREKCATVSEQGTGEAVQKAALELLLNERKRIAAAIRSIKFEGDTGFRPVSEMVAEHKQDPKKKAAIERAELRKQVAALKAVVDAWNNVEQEPVGVVETSDEWGVAGVVAAGTPVGTKLYAAPVRTKDLTDDDLQPFLDEWWNLPCDTAYDVKKIFRAVIAADREKNK